MCVRYLSMIEEFLYRHYFNWKFFGVTRDAVKNLSKTMEQLANDADIKAKRALVGTIFTIVIYEEPEILIEKLLELYITKKSDEI